MLSLRPSTPRHVGLASRVLLLLIAVGPAACRGLIAELDDVAQGEQGEQNELRRAPDDDPRDAKLAGELTQLAVDGTHAYLARRDGEILRVARAGGAGAVVQVVAAADPANGNFPGALAVDETHVYWTALGGMTSGSVLRAPKAGGPVEVIADHQPRPRGLALSARTVYWGTEGDAVAGGSGEGGSLNAVPKSGGQPTVLARESPIGSIAVTREHVYFARDPFSPRIPALGRVPIAGGAVEWLVKGRWIVDLHVAGDTVLWTERASAGAKVVTMSLTTREIVEHASGEIGATALRGGAVFFTEEERPDALLRVLPVGTTASGGGFGASGAPSSPPVTSSTLRRTRYADDANVFTGPIAADDTGVLWLETWWSYSASGPYTTLRSVSR